MKTVYKVPILRSESACQPQKFFVFSLIFLQMALTEFIETKAVDGCFNCCSGVF
jgi:hypothetical protein